SAGAAVAPAAAPGAPWASGAAVGAGAAAWGLGTAAVTPRADEADGALGAQADTITRIATRSAAIDEIARIAYFPSPRSVGPPVPNARSRTAPSRSGVQRTKLR